MLHSVSRSLLQSTSRDRVLDENEGQELERFTTPSESLLTNNGDLSNSSTAATSSLSKGRQAVPSHKAMNEADVEPGEQLEPGRPQEDLAEARQKHFILVADEPGTLLSRTFRHLAILGLLAFTALWGFLAREGLTALNTYDGKSVDPTIWVQTVGCLVIGYVVANRDVLERWEVYPPVYIALGTGFCGSLTTFSTFVVQVFLAFSDQKHYRRHGLHNVMDALSQTFLTVGMSLIALNAGYKLKRALPLPYIIHHLERQTIHRKLRRQYRRSGEGSGQIIDANTRLPYTFAADVSNFTLGAVTWIAAGILCATYAPFRHITYALVFAPPGAILRWYLSRLNSNRYSKSFPYWPLGTLAANLLATAVYCGAFVVQNLGTASKQDEQHLSVNGCYVIYGLQEGFAGCLSTISTFAVELSNIKPRRYALGYAIASYVIGICICVLLIGAPWWTLGMDGSCSSLS